jgi:hypothetical protein
MKSLIKVLTFVTVAAWCGTALAQETVIPLQNWGFDAPTYNGLAPFDNPAIGGGFTEITPGTVTVTPDAGTPPANGNFGVNEDLRATFPIVSIGVGESITLTGSVWMTNDGSASSYVGGSQFRIGLMNDNGYGGTAPAVQYGVTQIGGFTGYAPTPNSGGGAARAFTGYMLYVPTGNAAGNAFTGGTTTYPGMASDDVMNNAVGQLGARFNSGGGQARWLSGGGGYSLAGANTFVSGTSGQFSNGLGWTNNPGSGMYNFSISVTNLGTAQAGLAYSFVSVLQTTNGTGSPSIYQPVFDFAGTALDLGGGTTVLESTNGAFSFDSVGFYLGGNAELDEYDFTNVDVTYVPEPVSMALVGFGILTGGLFIRRRKG